MRNRGQIYWNWANADLHCRNHDERLESGVLLNIQVRLSITNQTQLFYGVYEKSGLMVFEDSYLERIGQTMSQALEWGLIAAREKAVQFVISEASTKITRRQRSF